MASEPVAERAGRGFRRDIAREMIEGFVDWKEGRGGGTDNDALRQKRRARHLEDDEAVLAEDKALMRCTADNERTAGRCDRADGVAHPRLHRTDHRQHDLMEV